METLTGVTIGEVLFEQEVKGTEAFRVYEGTFIPVNQKVMVKVYGKRGISDNREIQRIMDEIEWFKKLNHPFLATYITDFEKEEKIFIVFEFLANGQLAEYILNKGRMTELRARKFLSQAYSIIDYFHNVMRIVHRNLVPELFYLDEYENLRLIDFRFCVQIENEEFQISGQCGDLIFQPPEMQYSQFYNYLVDLWYIGVLMYFIVVGEYPFRMKIKEESSSEISYPNFLSSTFIDFLKKALHRNFRQRITTNSIVDHPWFSKTEFAKIVPYLHGVEMYGIYNEALSNSLASYGISVEKLVVDLSKRAFTTETSIFRLLSRKEFMLSMYPSESDSDWSNRERRPSGSSNRRLSWEMSSPVLLPQKPSFKPKQLPSPSACPVPVAARRSSHNLSSKIIPNK